MSEDEPHTYVCQSEDVAAYLDGELNATACASFELHVKECAVCAARLHEQRRLLCALDFALGESSLSLPLPQNFAQVVATRAQSDMSEMRSRIEHGRALRLCAALALLAFGLLGAAASRSVFLTARGIASYALSASDLVGHALYNTGAGFAVISRSLGGHLVFESHTFALPVLLVLIVALVLLPHQIVKYHRT
jgi:anti-sigma factor RsiW